MKTVYDRTAMLFGREAVEKLKVKAVIVFGIGGVGGFAAEALARTGIGTIGIVDCDRVDITNLNRQIIALTDTVGERKIDVTEQRIRAINPEIQVISSGKRVTAANTEEYCLCDFDYVIDAIDDVPAKLALIEAARTAGTPIICSMGTGNKMDPSRLQIAPIEKTHTCPLARKIRKELKIRGIKGVKVVFSDEEPERKEFPEDGGMAPASAVFVPASAGLLLASQVVRELIRTE